MVRKTLLFTACAMLLAGCGDRGAPMMEAGMVAKPTAGLASSDATQQFSYSHSWTLRMAHDAVKPRFARARDLCLRDKALSCRLVQASIASGDGSADSFASASLDVQLPHGKLDGFQRALLTPVNGEAPGDAVLQSSATQAQSVETAAGDAARKVAQLTAYRDRLAAIAERPNLSVDDLIKLESEQARVQGELDDAVALRRDLTDGIARESVSIQLAERVVSSGPIARALGSAGDTLAQSTASALLFLVAAIPWLPIVAAGIFLVSRLWRLFRRRRQAIVAPEKTGGG